jgi:hypothetical protein
LIIALSVVFGNTFIAQNKQINFPHADLYNVDTNLPTTANIVHIPKGTHQTTICAKTKHTKTVLFWLIPEAETWEERKLIEYDTNGDDGWSLTWAFGDKQLHDRIYVQAIGVNSVSNGSI